MATQAELIVDARNATGECPVWVSSEQALYWVDIPGRSWRAEERAVHAPPRAGGLRQLPEGQLMERLREAYRSDQLILFVGSGVSANIGLPPWRRLVDQIALQLDYDPEVFGTYGNFLSLAEYYRIKKGNIGGLRSWMDREWHRNIDIRESAIHRMIVHGRFASIYTTNYDRWLEYAHDAYDVDYVKIANASDLAKARDGVRQIIKFHGDFDDDSRMSMFRCHSRSIQLRSSPTSTCWRRSACWASRCSSNTAGWRSRA